jgi:hypothetical protein
MATITDVEKLVQSNREISDVGTPASDELIKRAESFLNVAFSKDFSDYLRRWGSLAIGPLEFYGITGEDFETSSIPNAIWYTHVKRKQLNLPNEYVIIGCNEGDEYYCLDTTDRVGSRIVVWDAVFRRVKSVRANSIFEFIISMVNEVIA